MTLSRFLRDYLYFPLGGNRKGSTRRYVNLFITMLLGGLWHGAGWTFVIWGALHGAYLGINHAWQTAQARLGIRGGSTWTRGLALGTTFIAVVIGWVFFRSEDIPTAISILAGMAGAHGITLPDAFSYRLGPAAPYISRLGITFVPGGGSLFVKTWLWICLLLPFVLFLPNSQELLARFHPALGMHADRSRGWLEWAPGASWAIAMGVVAAMGLLSLTRHSEFLYFQF